MTKPPKQPQNDQSRRFIEAARKAGADEDLESFKERLKKLVKPSPRSPNSADGKKK